MPKFNQYLCNFCGGCSAVCPKNAITVYIDLIDLDKSICNECLVCKKVCPITAISKN